MSIPSTSHVEIATDELNGLKQLGYACEGFDFAAKANVKSTLGRLLVIVHHAMLLVIKAYQFKPNVVYFNSRLENIASSRDFITIAIFRLFYVRRPKIMIKSHGSDLEVLVESSFWMRKIVLPFLKKEVGAWLFLSTEEQQKVIATGVLGIDTIFVVKNIVRVGQFTKTPSFRTDNRIAENSTILLFAGRVMREKGVHEVLEAFISLTKWHNVVLIIVGDGPDKAALAEQVAKEGLQNQVLFTGFIPEKEVVSYYANADILVFPTYFPEGFPMALFNAVGAGMNIVTTPTRAATDYLEEPHNCLWVKPNDSKSVENAVESLLQSPSTRTAMTAHNLNKCQLFSQEKVCAELSSIIENMRSKTKI